MDEATKTALAVPGSLGIILSIASFVFMGWLIRYVLKTNEKREDRLADIITIHLAAQKAQLDKLEEADRFQRSEHVAIMENQKKSIERQDAVALILERMAGMLSYGEIKAFKQAKGGA